MWLAWGGVSIGKKRGMYITRRATKQMNTTNTAMTVSRGWFAVGEGIPDSCLHAVFTSVVLAMGLASAHKISLL